MKIAKAFAIVFAMVLVVICFNAPFVHSGSSYDGHPWDGEDGGGGGTDGGQGRDTTLLINNPDTPLRSGTGVGSLEPSDLEMVVTTLRSIFWYHDIPSGVTSVSTKK